MKLYFDEMVSYYVIGGIVLLGILVNIIRSVAYNRFVKESGRAENSRNRYIKSILDSYVRKMEQDNVAYWDENSKKADRLDLFVDKSMYCLKFCGLRLFTWDKLCRLNFVVVTAVVSMICVFAGYMGNKQEVVLMMVLAGMLAISVLLVINMSASSQAKTNIIYFNIHDYLEDKLRNFVNVSEKNIHLQSSSAAEDNGEYNQDTEVPAPESVVSAQDSVELQNDENMVPDSAEYSRSNEKTESQGPIDKELIRKAFTDAVYEAALEKMAVSYTQKTAESAVREDGKVINILKNKEKQNNTQTGSVANMQEENATDNKIIEAILKEILQ